MSLLRRTFRSWWQVPRRASDPIDHRTVSFLELFYDLVYVMLIAQVAHVLAGHADLAGLGRFVFLFLIVWWAWLNGTLYHDLHGNNDIRTRLFTFLQMIAVAAMAIFAHDALGETSVGFALSYAGFLIVLAYLWWRTGVHDPTHRPLSRPYVIAFLVSIALFIGSVFVPAPMRFYLWGASLLLSLVLPSLSGLLTPDDPAVRAQREQAFILSESAEERFGLFTIIVLGEVIVGVINGVQEAHHFDWTIGITALLGMLVAIGIWWVYFDFLSHRHARTGPTSALTWSYLHLPLTMSITATGAAVLNVTAHVGDPLSDDVRWLLVGAVAVAFVTIALLLRSVRSTDEFRAIHRVGGLTILGAGIAAGLLGFTSLETIPLLVVLVGIMLVPVASGLWVWMKTLDSAAVAS